MILKALVNQLNHVEWNKKARAVKICCCSHVFRVCYYLYKLKCNYFFLKSTWNCGQVPCIKDPLLPRWVQSTPVSASSTQHMRELLAGNRAAVLPRHARGRRIRSYPDLCASCRMRETEDWGEFNISWQLYTVLYREIIIFCAAFLREYSYICSHVLPFTSFYAMFSPGKFKVPLTLTVKKKRIVHFEGLLEFKWSDLREQDVVGQGSFGAVFMVFHSNG